MSPLPLSVCMVSGAEAARIGRALESVAGWTREIIVVLNEEVRDGTEEIAVQHGAKVFREPWKGMIAQKSSAAQKASSDWILDLDADEEVSPELRQEIQTVLAQADCAAFSYPRLTSYCGRWIRHGDWYPDRQNRLWRRGRGQWGGTDPHAKLRVDGSVRKLTGDLRHYSHQSINHHIQKTIAFSDEFLRQHSTANREAGLAHLTFRPFWRFFRGYVLRRGFLDGWQGYYIAKHIAFETLVRYAKLRAANISPNSSQTMSSKD